MMTKMECRAYVLYSNHTDWFHSSGGECQGNRKRRRHMGEKEAAGGGSDEDHLGAAHARLIKSGIAGCGR